MAINQQKKSIPVTIVGGTNFSRAPKISSEETVNMFVTVAGKEKALVPYVGYESEKAIGSGDAREIFSSSRSSQAIVVMGDKVYAITTSFGYNQVGILNTKSGPVFISENQNNEIGIVDGSDLYIYNYGNNTFQTITLPTTSEGAFRPVYIDYLNTFFILTDGRTSIFQLSDSNDGTSYNPLNIAQLQTKADVLQAVVRLNRSLLVIGRNVTELWHPIEQQTTLFPFFRDNTVNIDYGCVSNETIASGFGLIVWLATNAKSGVTLIYADQTNPGFFQPLSNDGLDNILTNLTKPEDSFGFLFKEDNHVLYQITFPTDNLTIVYDFTLKLWYNASDECLNHSIIKRVAFFINDIYFISTKDNTIYRMSSDIYTYDGNEVPRVRITPPVRFPDNSRFIVNRVNLQMENGYNSEPSKVQLSISKNGGESYGNVVTHELQPQGQRQSDIDFFRLGLANDLRLQFRFYSKGRFIITNSSLDIVK